MKKFFHFSFGTILSIFITIAIISSFFFVFSQLFLNDFHLNRNVTINLDTNSHSNVNEKKSEITEDMIYKNLKTVNIDFAGIINSNIEIQNYIKQNLEKDKDFTVFHNIDKYLDGDLCLFSVINTFDKNKPFSDINSTSDIVSMLKKLGFNVATAGGANILNQGLDGLKSVLDTFKQNNIFYYGLNVQKLEMPNFIKNINDINIAFLHYNQSISNVGLQAAGDENLSRYIKLYDDKVVKADIKDAKSKGANIVVVTMTWNSNEEYSSDYQNNVVQNIANSGADIIIANSVTKCMPFNIVTSFDEKDNKKNVPVIYSLGALLNSNNDSIESLSSIILKAQIYYDLDENKVNKIMLDYVPVCLYKDETTEMGLQVVNPEDYINNVSINSKKDILKNTINYLKEMYKNLNTEIVVYQ